MRIAICDDEIEQIEVVVDFIRSWGEQRGIELELFTYTNSPELLFHWSEGKKFDLAVLDIKMKVLSGIELARIMRRTDEKLIIILITGMKDYVFQGYEIEALRYLLKPVSKKELYACLDRAKELMTLRGEETYVIPSEGQSVRLLYNEIYDFEIRSHYIIARTIKGIFSFKKKIEDLEQELPAGQFFRCHRSFIVNMHFVNTVSKMEAVLDDGTRIPVSKSRWNALNDAFLKYYAGGIRV